MEIGHKLYYDKETGVIVQHIWEASGEWIVETSREKDFADFPALSERNPETVGLLELEYGQYADEFTQASGYRVNPETGTLEFAYPDPNAPEDPPVYRAPLTEQVAQLQAADLDNKEAIASLFEMVLMGGGI